MDTNFHERVAQGERTLSYSQVADFISCRHRWFLRYACGVRPRQPARPLQLGDVVHKTIAAHLLNGSPVEQTVQEWTQDAFDNAPFAYDDNLPVGDQIMEVAESALIIGSMAISAVHATGWRTLRIPTETTTRYRREAGAATPVFGAIEASQLWDGASLPPPSVPQDIAAVEIGLHYPIWPEWYWNHFAAHLDWLALDEKTGRVWLVDFKVRKQFSSADYEEVNLQHMVYAYLCHLHGIKVHGTVTIEIKAEAPKVPSLTQSGTMSRARIATDWPTYKAAVIAAGLQPSDYSEMEYKLDVPFTNIMVMPRSERLLESAWENIVIPAAAEMAGILENSDIKDADVPDGVIRHLSPRTCQACGVRDLCLAGLHGDDIEPFLWKYQAREDRMHLLRSA